MGEAVAIIKILLVVVAAVSTIHSLATAPDADEPADPMEETGVRVNACSTQEAIRIVYGTQEVGGNDVFRETSGTDLSYLWIVQALGEGPCEGVNQIWLGDKPISDFGSYASYWFHDGAADQVVDSNLHAWNPLWTDPMHYTCYIVLKLYFDPDYFSGIPKRLVQLKGRKLYDFRDSSTAWSDNAVLALYDYVTSNRYGLGISAEKIDLPSWISAANYFDSKGWSFNMVVYKSEAALDIIKAILSHFRGALIWFNGKFYLRYADLNEESSRMTLEDKHIVQNDNGLAAISVLQPSKFNKPDAIRVKYYNEYVLDDIMIGDDSGTVRQVDLLGCTDREMAANLGYYSLERARLDRSIVGKFRDDAIQLDPHDLVTLNCSALSISSQLMRVQDANILPDGLIELTLMYEDLSLYDDDYDVATEGVYTCSLPDRNAEPPSVEDASMTEETYDYRGRTFTRLLISFALPSNYPWFDHVDVYISSDDATYDFLYPVNTDFAIENVEEGRDYFVRLKTVSIWKTKQADANDPKLHKLVQGYADVPESLGSLEVVVNASTVNLYSSKVSDTDIELYEFRLGSSWAGAIFLAALRAPNYSLYGVKPGSHTFMANTLSNNDEYGDTPKFKSVILIDPPDGWTVQDTDAISNLIVNFDMELDSNWSDYNSPTANVRSSDQKHSDTYSRKFTSDGANDGIKSDVFTSVNSAKYGLSIWVYPDDATKVGVKVRTGDDSGWAYDTEQGLTQDAWNEIVITYSEGAATGGAGAYLVIEDASGDTGDWYVDDACLLRGDFTDNMQPVLYGGEAYMKCAHTSDVVAGTFVSEIFDLGSSGRYLAYCLAEIAVTGTGTTWGDKFPSPTTWAQGNADTLSWNEIFQLSAGPSVQITLKYGDTSPPTSEVTRMEILSAIVTGRYYQIEITITDPNVNVNALIEAFTLKYCQ